MKKILPLIPWVVVCYAAAAIGAIATADAPTFYASLNKPDWAPPAAVFGPVWTVLYGMMAVAAWLVWEVRDRSPQRARWVLRLFILQLAVNALWSWVFFAWHRGGLAVMDIGGLWILLLLTTIGFYRLRALAGLLLLPYLAWVTFATALTLSVWHRNPGVL